MKLQELLDLETANPTVWALQQLVLRCSKTELAAIGRVCRKLEATLYKTVTKEMTIEQISKLITQAETMLKHGELED